MKNHDLLKAAYAAFNRRDIDAALTVMHPEVEWANGMEGGSVRGHRAVREYWTRQWGTIDPRVEPLSFAEDELGRTIVKVHQVVRDLQGSVIADRTVCHAYAFEGDLVKSMLIQEPSESRAQNRVKVISREMQAILDAQQVSALANLPAMEISEARSAFATAAAGWNLTLPDLKTENVVLDGVPCRILVPPFRKEGTVIFVHGGGWTLGSPATHERFARLLAIHSATTVVVPDYRLAPETPCPGAIEDVAKAVHAISSAPGGGGPLVLCGDSAGATIALATALAYPPSNLVALSLLYGCFEPNFNTDSHLRSGDGRYGLSTERMRWYWGNWLGDAHDPRAAPLHADLSGLPWTYLLGAGLDPLCDDTVNLTGRLVAHGVECRADYVPGVVHGFLQMTAMLREARSALRTLSQVIRERLDERESYSEGGALASTTPVTEPSAQQAVRQGSL